jgi:hypothetical protein
LRALPDGRKSPGGSKLVTAIGIGLAADVGRIRSS